MTEQSPQEHATMIDNEIDLAELFRVLWGGKWLISGITTAAAIIAIAVALWLPDIYRSQALLAPNQNDGASGLSSLASQFGGLASLAGVNVGDSKDNKTGLGLEILKSRKFLSEFIQRHDLMVPLMASDGWNRASGELEIDPDIYDVATGKWVRDAKPPRTSVPSLQEAVEKFTEGLSVDQDSATGTVSIAVEHFSPTVARQWVDWLIIDLNTKIMQQDVAEAEQSIAYLNEKIASTSASELRLAFFNMIEEQTKTVMLAQVSDEYLLKTIDPAIAPELKARPSRALIVIAVTFLGGFLGVVVQFVRPKTVAARQAASG